MGCKNNFSGHSQRNNINYNNDVKTTNASLKREKTQQRRADCMTTTDERRLLNNKTALSDIATGVQQKGGVTLRCDGWTAGCVDQRERERERKTMNEEEQVKMWSPATSCRLAQTHRSFITTLQYRTKDLDLNFNGVRRCIGTRTSTDTILQHPLCS